MFEILLVFTCATLITWYLRQNFVRMSRMAENIGGPKGLPILGHIHMFLGKEFLDAMMHVDNQYFGIARFWLGHKLIISMNNPILYSDLLTNKSALDKGEFYHFMKPLFGDGLIASDTQIWQINRKVVAPTLNNIKIKSNLTIFTEGSNVMSQAWEKKIGLKFEPYADVSRATFAFTLRSALGMDAEWSNSQVDEMVALVNGISAGVAYRFLRPWLYPDFIFYLTPTGRKVHKKTNAFRKVLKEMIASKIGRDSDGGFVSHILAASKVNDKFTDAAVLDELSTYMTAGFETTSTAITFCLIMLGCYPELQEKVYDEQISIIPVGTDGDGSPDWDSLSKMELLESFIKETLRLFPVITIIGRQLSTDVSVGNQILPKGSFAMIPIYAVHRKPELWYNPTEFDPSRFSKEHENIRNPLAFLPFGGGTRVCMGQKYAMIAIKSMLTAIIRRYKIKTDYKMEEINLSKAVTLNTNGLTITVEYRY